MNWQAALFTLPKSLPSELEQSSTSMTRALLNSSLTTVLPEGLNSLLLFHSELFQIQCLVLVV